MAIHADGIETITAGLSRASQETETKSRALMQNLWRQADSDNPNRNGLVVSWASVQERAGAAFL